jgi:hypothetical protein
MIQMGENGSTLRKSCPNATLATKNPTLLGLELNPAFHDERLATNSLSHGLTLLPV